MKVSRRVLLTGGAAFAAASLTSAQERRGLKLFMNCDMEGSSGIFTGEQA